MDCCIRRKCQLVDMAPQSGTEMIAHSSAGKEPRAPEQINETGSPTLSECLPLKWMGQHMQGWKGHFDPKAKSPRLVPESRESSRDVVPFVVRRGLARTNLFEARQLEAENGRMNKKNISPRQDHITMMHTLAGYVQLLSFLWSCLTTLLIDCHLEERSGRVALLAPSLKGAMVAPRISGYLCAPYDVLNPLRFDLDFYSVACPQ